MGSARAHVGRYEPEIPGVPTAQVLTVQLTQFFDRLAARPLPAHLVDIIDQLEHASSSSIRPHPVLTEAGAAD